MRLLPALPLLLACLASGISAFAHADALLPAEDPGDPDTLIPAPQAPSFASTETRLPGGRVTEIEVQSGGSRYYVQPQTAAGGARGESQGTVRWNVLNFDFRRPSGSGAADTAPAPVPPPPRAD